LFAYLSGNGEIAGWITSLAGEKKSGKRGDFLHLLRNTPACGTVRPDKTGFQYFCDTHHKTIDLMNC